MRSIIFSFIDSHEQLRLHKKTKTFEESLIDACTGKVKNNRKRKFEIEKLDDKKLNKKKRKNKKQKFGSTIGKGYYQHGTHNGHDKGEAMTSIEYNGHRHAPRKEESTSVRKSFRRSGSEWRADSRRCVQSVPKLFFSSRRLFTIKYFFHGTVFYLTDSSVKQGAFFAVELRT